MEQLSRRNFLQVAPVLALSQFGYVSNVQAGTRESLKPLIIFFQGGAQSPYEFTSPLSNSPKELRGPFGSIQTRMGIRIGEAFPGFAAIAHKTSVIRSLDCENTSHNAKPLVQGKLCESGSKLANGGIPYSVIDTPSSFSPHNTLDPSSSFLVEWNKKEQRHKLPETICDPNLRQRMELLDEVDTFPTQSPAVRLMHKNRELARSILLGDGKLSDALNITPDQLKRYGDNPVGKAAALATNLVRGGAGIVLIHNESQLEGASGSGWDMHSDLEARTKILAPATDKAIVALAEDALRDDRPVAIFTEHGRTPVMNGSGGRDHHSVGYFVGVGGKFRVDVVVGDVDKNGEIKSDRVAASQILPTMLAAAGAKRDPREPVVKAILKS